MKINHAHTSKLKEAFWLSGESHFKNFSPDTNSSRFKVQGSGLVIRLVNGIPSTRYRHPDAFVKRTNLQKDPPEQWIKMIRKRNQVTP